MKYKTLFRLLLKAIGVWLFVDGCSFLIVQGGGFLITFLKQGFAAGFSGYLISSTTGFGAKVGAGLYLFFGGEWIVNKAIPTNRPYCPECAYDLSGAVTNRCPECGTPFRPEDVRPQGVPDEPSDAAL